MRSHPLLVCFSLLGGSVSAHAQSAPPSEPGTKTTSETEKPKNESDEAGTSEDSPAKSPPTAEENRALFEHAESVYDSGDYETAIKLFAELYHRTNHPAILFNMAQAHRMAGPKHCQAAHQLYLDYLVHDAQPPNGREVRERIQELEPCALAAAKKEEESKAAKETRPESKPTRPVAAQATSITSGALLLAGLGLFTAAKIRFNQAQADCPCEPGSLSAWETLEKVSLGTMAVGAAGLTAGGVWWWASANPTATEESLWLGVGGTF